MTGEIPRFMDDLLDGGVKGKLYINKDSKDPYRVTGVEYGVNTDNGFVELFVNFLEHYRNDGNGEQSKVCTRKFIDCLYDERIRI